MTLSWAEHRYHRDWAKPYAPTYRLRISQNPHVRIFVRINKELTRSQFQHAIDRRLIEEGFK